MDFVATATGRVFHESRTDAQTNAHRPQRQMTRRGWMLAGIFILAVAVRLPLVPEDATPRLGSDEDEYDTYAWNLAQGRGYRGPTPAYRDREHLTSWRMPCPSLMFALVYKLVGHNPNAAVRANVLV